MILCGFEGCGQPHHSIGYCKAHYMQHRRGKTLVPRDLIRSARFRGHSPEYIDTLRRVSEVSKTRQPLLAQALELGLGSGERLYLLRFHARKHGFVVENPHPQPKTEDAQRLRDRYDHLVSLHCCVTCAKKLPEGDKRVKCNGCRGRDKARRSGVSLKRDKRFDPKVMGRCPVCSLLLP